MKKVIFFLAMSLFGAGLINVTAQKYVVAGSSLQDSINAAESGTTVYVGAGTYTGNFIMKAGVNVSGSWNADFTVQDRTLYPSVLDGGLSGIVLTDTATVKTKSTRWSYFVIQNGKNTGNGAGVLLIKNGSVSHCLIQKNVSTGYGAGVANDAVTANTDVLVDNCEILNNTAKQGAGVRVRGTVQNSIIRGNKTTTGAGAGAHLQGGILRNCLLENNQSGENAAGVRMYGTCKMINCAVVNNTAVGKIGGVSMESNASVVVNCVIAGNEANTTASSYTGGIRMNTGKTTNVFVNNIVWGNTLGGSIDAAAQILKPEQCSTIVNNAVYNMTLAATNLNLVADNAAAEGPQFVDPANGDYRLQYTSPCFNTGLNSAVADYSITSDLDGLTRILGETVDMGAYEVPYYTLSLNIGEHGTATVADTAAAAVYNMPKGSQLAVKFAAAGGYKLAGVTYNTTDVTSDVLENVYTTPAIEKNSELAATFTVTTGTQLISEQNITVLGENGNIRIINAQDQQVVVYNMLGAEQLRFEALSNDVTLSMNPSVYLVRIGHSTHKVLVK